MARRLAFRRYSCGSEADCLAPEPPSPRDPQRAWSLGCTVLRQGLVEASHSIENTPDILGKLFLTPALNGEKTLAFFDSFQRFPGWWRVRGSSELT
jgi:hypothetical protein